MGNYGPIVLFNLMLKWKIDIEFFLQTVDLSKKKSNFASNASSPACHVLFIPWITSPICHKPVILQMNQQSHRYTDSNRQKITERNPAAKIILWWFYFYLFQKFCVCQGLCQKEDAKNVELTYMQLLAQSLNLNPYTSDPRALS